MPGKKYRAFKQVSKKNISSGEIVVLLLKFASYYFLKEALDETIIQYKCWQTIKALNGGLPIWLILGIVFLTLIVHTPTALSPQNCKDNVDRSLISWPISYRLPVRNWWLLSIIWHLNFLCYYTILHDITRYSTRLYRAFGQTNVHCVYKYSTRANP